eukprot:9169117-Heterocapsa_arctica.AAC.1
MGNHGGPAGVVGSRPATSSAEARGAPGGRPLRRPSRGGPGVRDENVQHLALPRQAVQRPPLLQQQISGRGLRQPPEPLECVGDRRASEDLLEEHAEDRHHGQAVVRDLRSEIRGEEVSTVSDLRGEFC